MRVLFLYAHPDDEAFAAAGTIRKHVDAGDEVIVVSMCNGARPGAREVAKQRGEAFVRSCELLGVQGGIGIEADLSMSYNMIINFAVDAIASIHPDIVYTNSPTDINADHRQLAEAVMVACRPKPGSTVRKLYFSEITSSTPWSFGQINGSFEPNTFVDISDYVDAKEAAIKLYSTEIYGYPDARSYEAALVHAAHRGTTIGVQAAEAFKLVFSKE